MSNFDKGWQCPACRTHYAPFVDRCRCECAKVQAEQTGPAQPTQSVNTDHIPPALSARCRSCGATSPHVCAGIVFGTSGRAYDATPELEQQRNANAKLADMYKQKL